MSAIDNRLKVIITNQPWTVEASIYAWFVIYSLLMMGTMVLHFAVDLAPLADETDLLVIDNLQFFQCEHTP